MGARNALTSVARTAFGFALLVGLAGCAYYSTGGGVPEHMKTIGAEFFENETAETGLSEYMTRALSELLLSRPQFRYGSSRNADAVVRGTVIDLVDEPLTYSGGQPTQYQVLVRIDVEVYDRVKRRTLWQREGLEGQGVYDPAGGLVARQEALGTAFRELAGRVVDGIVSGW